MSNKQLFAILVTVLTVGACEISAQRIPASVRKTGTSNQVTTKTINERNQREKLAISAKYPHISGVDQFNKIAEQVVKRSISEFKRDLDPPDSYTTRNRELHISYKIIFKDNRLISVSFFRDQDTGGAHPYGYSFPLNYDVKQQKEIALYELFSSSDYLRTISDYCIRVLRNQVPDYGQLRDGAAPTLDNYKNWNVINNALQITFNAYQVASYADGPKQCRAPFSVLRQKISKTGPIYHLVK